MKTLGTKLDIDIFSRMIRVDTLIYFEGPLLELYLDQHDHDKYYFCRWVDDDENGNRWLVYDVKRESFLSFFKKNKTSRDLIKSAINIYLYDMYEEDSKLYQINYHQIPPEYLPEETAEFDSSTYTKAAQDIGNSFLKRDETLKQNELHTAFADINAKLNAILEQTKQSANDNNESHHEGHLLRLVSSNPYVLDDNETIEETRNIL